MCVPSEQDHTPQRDGDLPGDELQEPKPTVFGRVIDRIRLGRGIKIHGFEAMPTREVCETARAFRLPIFVDVVSRPEVMDMLAPQYPDVDFIVAHLGSYTDDWRAHQQVVYQIARYSNVYADTSAVRRFDYIVEAVKRAGPRKLLFGSDFPLITPDRWLKDFEEAGFKPEVRPLILKDNAVRLLGLGNG